MINKFAGFDDNWKPFFGWTCGWCPLENDGSQPKPFQSMNATKVLVHVAKVSGYDVRPCRGCIPATKSRQYRDLHLAKTLTKEQRKSRKDSLLTAPTIRVMDCLPSAGLSDDLGSECEDIGVESMNNDDYGDNTFSAQSDTQNSNEHAISDDNNEQQVFM